MLGQIDLAHAAQPQHAHDGVAGEAFPKLNATPLPPLPVRL